MNTVFGPASSSQFQLSPDGDVQLMDARVTDPVAFAHITDLHWPPPPANWDEVNREYQAISCSGGLRPVQTPLRQLQEELGAMLDEIQARGADFVLFGGDNIDCYHPQTARLLLTACQERGLRAYFVMGNHDWDEEYPPTVNGFAPTGDARDCVHRLITQKYDVELRNRRVHKLMIEDWQMPGLYYAFECKGIRFIILDPFHIPPKHHPAEPWDGHRMASFYDEEQVDWLIKQLEGDGPIIVAQHVPFNPVTPTYQPEAWVRLGYAWGGCIFPFDDQSRRVRLALENCPNLLGIIVGHKHFRADDPLGNTWQFMTELSGENVYRYVNITSTPSPESL